MAQLLIGLLMFAMVLVCVALILLVLIQLPKKEAGIGVAFGGGATDALFGAGSGNVLTKATKWAAIAFFGLSVLIGFVQSRSGDRARASSVGERIEEESKKLSSPPVNIPAPTQPNVVTPAVAPVVPPVTAPSTTAPAATPSVPPAAEAPASK